MKILNIVLRYLFSWIDAIAARLITTVYRLISNLSELVLYSDDIIKVISKRIGLILGIFMLFKLAVSLISYMISPDKMKDGKQGGGKLIVHVGVSLALLVSINFIFKEAYRIQGIVVNSRIIEKVFFGNAGIVKSDNSNENNSVKMDIGYYLYTGFIYPNTEVFGDTCDDLWDTRFDINKKEAGHEKSCAEMLQEKLSDDARRSIYKAKNTLDMSYVFFEYDLMSSASTYKDVLDFDYTPIISNVAGVMVLFVLISFSMDLATRAVKLLFLQIISPIPIISYMDIGKGQEIFKKWGKECINTYLTVFIRLVSINFAVFMIVLIRGNYKNVFVNNVWLNIFLIIGCLMFAKQVPNLIEEFLGIKLNGLSLKPLKKFEEQALFGKYIGSAGEKSIKKVAGIAGGGIAGFGAGLKAAGANAFSPGTGGRILGAGVGFASAFSRGLVSGFKGEKFGKIYSSSYGAAMESKERRMNKKLDDVSTGQILKNKLQRSVHQKTRGQRADELDKAIESYISKGEKVKNAIYANDKATITANGREFSGAKGLKEFIDSMQSPVQQVGEGAAAFAQRQQDFLAEKKKYQDALDIRVAEVTSGYRVIDDNAGGTGGGNAANKAVKELIESMQSQLEEINDEGISLYGDANKEGSFSVISDPTILIAQDGSMTAGLKNSLGSAAGAQTTISSAAGHDRDVDKYATKKDK